MFCGPNETLFPKKASRAGPACGAIVSTDSPVGRPTDFRKNASFGSNGPEFGPALLSDLFFQGGEPLVEVLDLFDEFGESTDQHMNAPLQPQLAGG